MATVLLFMMLLEQGTGVPYKVMFNISKAYQNLMYGRGADIRKGFNGLFGLVQKYFLLL